MKKFLIAFTFLYSCLAFCQDYKSDIINQFMDYNALIENKEFRKALETYGNEDFFKFVPKEQLILFMEQMFESKDFEYKIYKPKDIKVEDQIIKENNNSFLKLSFLQSLDMKFNSSEMTSDQMLSALQAGFGYEAVKYNSSNNFFEIKSIKQVVANSKDFKNWKFSIIEKEQIPILKQFIPETFLRTLK